MPLKTINLDQISTTGLISGSSQLTSDFDNRYILSGSVTSGTTISDWNGYDWYKKSNNTGSFPLAGEEIQGRGDGRYEFGERIHAEFLRDMPDGQETNQTLDINLFNSYP